MVEESNEKKSFLKWVKEHRKQLIFAGISITAVIGMVFGIKNRTVLLNMWSDLENTISKSAKSIKLPTNSVTSVTMPVQAKTVTSVIKEVSPAKIIPIDSVNIDKVPFDVHKHVRNLPLGQHPSPEKVATALENGIILLPGQTWVKDYPKRVSAA